MAQCSICGREFRNIKIHTARVHGKGWDTTANLPNKTKETELALLEESKTEPIPENRIIVALLDRNDQLQAQIDRLQDLVDALTEQGNKLQAEVDKLRRPVRQHLSAHLTERVQNALTVDQWNQLRNNTSE